MREQTKLKQLRSERGFTASHMIKKLQIPRTNYYRYESEDITPPLHTAIKIADALGVDVKEIWVKKDDQLSS